MREDDCHDIRRSEALLLSRRRSLRVVGAGAAGALAGSGGLARLRSAYAGEDEGLPGRFTRMFRLPPRSRSRARA